MKKTTFYFLALLLSANFDACAQKDIPQVQLNQLGFLPSWPKLAVVTGNVTDNRFYVLAAGGKDTVFRGTLSSQRQSRNSSTVTCIADFSKLGKRGKYMIVLPGGGRSSAFDIDDRVYADVAKSVLKAFYFMRSDMPLQPSFAGKWARPAGHPDTEVLVHPSAASASRPAGTVISSPKGWYDAGDYNKYIVNSGITMGTILSAYEDFPAYFNKTSLNLPESANPVPDILDEALYNLRWMLTMQDPSDGGVYHKCTNAAFDGMVMPGVTKDPRYVVQKSTGATLDFAAVTAQAARIYKNYGRQFPGLADSCLTASKKAWAWALGNPQLQYSQRLINEKYDPDISTGEYGDRRVNDEWLWASAELFATTKDSSFFVKLRSLLKDNVDLPSWGNVAMMGYFTLRRLEPSIPKGYATQIRAVKDSILKKAEALLPGMARSAFATVMGQTPNDFVWGSNAVAANQGMLLLNAYLITKDKRFLDGAASNLDYLLGRNATGYCFVTGFGSKPPMHPHHRPSEADGITEPVPGLLAGGPNPGRQDKCHYKFTEPETAYSDVTCSYASNEIAINWNAPAVYLFNGLVALTAK